jgi:hypothetical protein
MLVSYIRIAERSWWNANTSVKSHTWRFPGQPTQRRVSVRISAPVVDTSSRVRVDDILPLLDQQILCWIETLGWMHRVNGDLNPYKEQLNNLIFFFSGLAFENDAAFSLSSFGFTGPKGPKTVAVNCNALIPKALRTVAEILSLHTTRILNVWATDWEPLQVDKAGPDRCLCGSVLYESVLRHPILSAFRVLASCPACGPVVDRAVDSQSQVESLPPCEGPPEYINNGGSSQLRWRVRLQAGHGNLHACALIQRLMYSPGRSSAPIVEGPSLGGTINLAVPPDLPPGSYPVALACADRNGISLRRDMVYLNRRIH